MSKKRVLLFLIPISLAIILCIYLWGTPVEKSYNGFYVNIETKEILGKCNIKIKGHFRETAGLESGKPIGNFSGSIYIDNEKYNLTGQTNLNDNFDYFKNSEGNNLLGLTTSLKSEKTYRFGIYDDFNDNYIYISIYDVADFLTPSPIKIIATTEIVDDDNDILEKLDFWS